MSNRQVFSEKVVINSKLKCFASFLIVTSVPYLPYLPKRFVGFFDKVIKSVYCPSYSKRTTRKTIKKNEKPNRKETNIKKPSGEQLFLEQRIFHCKITVICVYLNYNLTKIAEQDLDIF